MNKKGNIMLLIYFILILFIILFLGFILVVGGAILNWTFDVAVPELSYLGMVGDANATQIASVTITPLNSMVQSLTWLTGVLYVLMLIGSFAFVMVVKVTPSKWLIGFYFMCVIILIMGSIFISNIYEEFATGTDDLSTRLREQVLLNYMILYSPAIFSVIAFLVGILLFSGMNQEELY